TSPGYFGHPSSRRIDLPDTIIPGIGQINRGRVFRGNPQIMNPIEFGVHRRTVVSLAPPRPGSGHNRQKPAGFQPPDAMSGHLHEIEIALLVKIDTEWRR